MNLRKTRSQTRNESNARSTAESHKNISEEQNSSNHAVNELPLYKKYEEMLTLLRVAELQKILSFLNVTLAGRKQDLQKRVLDLLGKNFELVSDKIRDVYLQSIAENRSLNTLSVLPSAYGPTAPKRMYSHMQMPQVQPASSLVNSAGVPQQATHVPRNPADVAAVAAAAAAAAGGVNPFLHTMSPIPLHPDVRLKKLAFYDVLGTLIQPSSLLPRTTQRIQEAAYYFTLTPQQATEIAMNRDIRNATKIEHAIQVQLRFCLMETSCEQDDCFPPSVSVKVNNKLCQLPNVIPTNRPNVEPKRPPRPVNVTSNVKLSPTVTNTITVQWCPDYSRGYCLAAYLVKKLTSAQLLNRMKTKGVKPADYTRGLIKEKLTEDADCEIATTMLKVSLNCPLGKMKMSIPCRASTCSHLQCFDANLFLQMNERKPTWNCPVCDKPAVYDTLVIDGYFQEVLASPLLKPDDTEIQLHKDGSWSTHSLRNDTQSLDTPSKTTDKVEIVPDDLEVIDDLKPTKPIISALTAQDQPTSTTNSDTVDLTLSDSDDDLPLAKRRPATSSSSLASSNVKPNITASNVSNSNINAAEHALLQRNVNKFIQNEFELNAPMLPRSNSTTVVDLSPQSEINSNFTHSSKIFDNNLQDTLEQQQQQ